MINGIKDNEILNLDSVSFSWDDWMIAWMMLIG